MSYERLTELLKLHSRIVFFGGAGVSTESGIGDFRSADGLYRKHFDYPAEVMLSHDFFLEKTELFFDFYKEHMVFPAAKPNGAHRALAKLEQMGKLSAVVTQNIDGLHQMAGSKRVFELHGSVHRNTCMGCGREYGLDAVMAKKGVPKCEWCGAVIKPDVVLYGEALDEKTVENACLAIETADMLIIGGTSLTVYPAASFIRLFTGDETVVINRDATQADRRASIVIREPVGEVLEKAVENMYKKSGE